MTKPLFGVEHCTLTNKMLIQFYSSLMMMEEVKFSVMFLVIVNAIVSSSITLLHIAAAVLNLFMF